MSYSFRNRSLAGTLGQNQPDPYDLSMCWPQFIEEARQIVSQIQGNIAVVQQQNPQRAEELDRELRSLIKQHRDRNACPNVSDGGHLFTFETQDLINRSEAAKTGRSATLSIEEEQAILEATLPIPEPEPSFLHRNAMPLIVRGGVLVLGILGMILLIRV